MSRNLCSTVCYYCDTPPVLDEAPRPATAADVYQFHEYVGMIVANATCPACEARYLAWIDDRPSEHGRRYGGRWREPFYDLSFRSSFNDEPDTDDLPRFKVKAERVWTRLGPWSTCVHERAKNDCRLCAADKEKRK